MDNKIDLDFFSYDCSKSEKGTITRNMKHTITFREILPDYFDHLKRENGSAKTTISTYRSRLNQYCQWLEENGHPNTKIGTAFETINLKGYKYALMEKKQRPRSIRGSLNAIRSLGQYLVDTKIYPENPALAVKMPPKDQATRLLISDQEIQSLLDATERQAKPRKVAFSRALLITLAFTGVRADELVNIKVQDVLVGRRELLVVNGKGGKSRTLYPPTNFFIAMEAWLHEREKLECDHDYLWAHGKSSHMSYDWLLSHLEELKAVAGYKNACNIKPHSIRHWFASKLYSQHSNIKMVQAALGHSDPQTTFVYLHLDEEDARGMSQLTLERPIENNESVGKQKHASQSLDSRNTRSRTRRARNDGRSSLQRQ